MERAKYQNLNNESLNPLSNEQLVEAAKKGDEEAKNSLCQRNKGLVLKYAKKYASMCRNCLSEDDLYSAGQIGLLQAIDHYDSKKGSLFSTYAVYRIRKAILTEIQSYNYPIRIPADMQEKIRKVRQVEYELASEGIWEEDLIVAIVDKLKDKNMPLSKEDVIECHQLYQQVMSCTSLNASKDKDSDVELGDTIQADIKDNPESILDQLDNKECLKNLLNILDDQEKKIISARYNLDGKGFRTWEEVGKELNVTREYVRHIEAKARRKMRISRN